MAEGNLILSHQLKDPTYNGNTPTEAWIPLADLYKNGDDQVNLYLRAKLDNEVVSTNNLISGAVTSDKIANNAVISEKIKNGAVTEYKIQDGAVTQTKIATSAVSTNNLIDSAVTSEKIKNGAVTEYKIESGAVTSNKIYKGAVTSNKIANDSIINSHIAGNTITLNKLDTQLKGVFIGSINPSLIENFAETFDIWGKDGITTIIQPENEKVTINGDDFPAFELKLTSWLKYQAWEQKISLVNKFSYKIAYWDNAELKYLEWTPNETPNIEGDSDYPEYYDTTSILLDTNDNNISIVDLFKNNSDYPIRQMFNSTWASIEQNIILTTLRNNLEDFIINANSGAYSVINQEMTKEKALLLGNGIVGKSTLGNFPIYGYSNSLWGYDAGSAAVNYKFLFEMYINSFQCGFTDSNYGNLSIPSPPWWWQGARPDLIMSVSIDDYFNTLGLSEIDYNKIGLWIEI